MSTRALLQALRQAGFAAGQPQRLPRLPPATGPQIVVGLASTIGLCIDCHTPEAAPMSLDIDRTRYFAGGKAFPKELLYGAAPGFPAIIFTANITPHNPTGIATYTKQDIINVFKKGHAKDLTCLCAPTHGGPTSPYANMKDGDINDIATYLLALPPIENMAKPNECEATGMCQL